MSAVTAAVAGAVTTIPAADNAAALAHFAARLAFETDVSDVAADLAAGVPGVVVVDSRSQESWDQGHVQGAVHLPTGEIAARAATSIPADVTVVTYCWGPGCNGATRAALEFAKLGYRVKEMIGGFEYWAREGFPVETRSGVSRKPIDPLTAPVSGIACAC
ncbi:rhodanese-like domain-containing protein [Nonomuraea sp. NN258]|uniref:rhodanese-like domain-containing protein n=1 Tax=Nonomuraea antri TaxID=2730852 RepID=UPI00156A2169|nr:rhodanese-like domain-containing protein [Nonomuraea antri]NRQ32306.1 rhodanese-like domain-containing protein [Nonomuraea antri]